MNMPLMPKATAVWLVENTSLTFNQIADFCGMHSLEIQAIADGDVGTHIQGLNPILNNQLTAEEIKRCEQDPNASLTLSVNEEVERLIKRGVRYVSNAKRGDRPSAIAWIVKHHPEISDKALIKLLRTTKPTITSIRERTHKNINSIVPKNPVTLGLCSEADLEKALAVSKKGA